MNLILIEEGVLQLIFEEISGKSVADVHGFLEDIAEAAGEHDSSLEAFLACKRLLEGLNIGQSASVVSAS